MQQMLVLKQPKIILDDADESDDDIENSSSFAIVQKALSDENEDEFEAGSLAPEVAEEEEAPAEEQVERPRLQLRAKKHKIKKPPQKEPVQPGKTRGFYLKPTDEQRRRLIELTVIGGQSILSSSAKLNIRYTTARNIIEWYRKTGRLYRSKHD